MKKVLSLLIVLSAGLHSNSQTYDILKSIARELQNYETYQSVCELTLSMPFGDTLTFESNITTEKIPADKLCGFQYSFQRPEGQRDAKAHDYTLYFDSTIYKSYLGKVKKTSFHDSPSQFFIMKLEDGYILPIFKRPRYYSVMPYELSRFIDDVVNDSNMIISQKPDTVIESVTCLRYIIESKSTNPSFDKTNPEHWKEGKTIYELCFHKSGLYPVLYKNEVYTSFINTLEIAHFRNTNINHNLPEKYFSEEYLLPPNWEDPEPLEQTVKNTPEDLVGKQAPGWSLPVLGSDQLYSSEHLKGKTVLLEFTATWCGHCWSAAKVMNRLEARFKDDDNIEIVSIYSSDIDKKETVEKFANKMNATSTILYSANEVGEQYHVHGYPNFFIISPEGIVTKCFPGYFTTIETEIINALSNSND